MEQARQLNNQQQQQQPQQQRLEVVVIAGQDLKSITSFLSSGSSKMSSYVVCWVDPRSKVSTRIVKRGGRDPVWNHPLALPVDAAALANPYACLTLQVMSSSAYPSRYDAVVGTAWMPLHEIARLSASASAVDSNAVTLAVQRPSGRMQGSIRLCVCLIGAGLDAPPRFQPPPKALLAPPQLQLQHHLQQHQNQHQNQHQQSLSPPSFSSSSSYSGLFDDLPSSISPSSSSAGAVSSMEPVEGIPVIAYPAAAAHHQYQTLPAPSAPPVPPPPVLDGNGRGRGHGHGHGNGHGRGDGHGLLLGVLGGLFAALLLGDIFFQ